MGSPGLVVLHEAISLMGYLPAPQPLAHLHSQAEGLSARVGCWNPWPLAPLSAHVERSGACLRWALPLSLRLRSRWASCHPLMSTGKSWGGFQLCALTSDPCQSKSLDGQPVLMRKALAHRAS